MEVTQCAMRSPQPGFLAGYSGTVQWSKLQIRTSQSNLGSGYP